MSGACKGATAPTEARDTASRELSELRARVAELERQLADAERELARLGLPEVVATWE